MRCRASSIAAERPALADAPPAIAEHVKALPAPPAPPPPPPLPRLARDCDTRRAGCRAATAAGRTVRGRYAGRLRAAGAPADYLAEARRQSPTIDSLIQAKTVLGNPLQLAAAALAAGDLPAPRRSARA